MDFFERLKRAARRLAEIRRRGLEEDEEADEITRALDEVFGKVVLWTRHIDDTDRLALIWMPQDDRIAVAEVDLKLGEVPRLRILNIWGLLEGLIAEEVAG